MTTTIMTIYLKPWQTNKWPVSNYHFSYCFITYVWVWIFLYTWLPFSLTCDLAQTGFI